MKKRIGFLSIVLLAACTTEALPSQPLNEQRTILVENKEVSTLIASDAFYPPAFTIEHVQVEEDQTTGMMKIRVDYLLTEELRKKLGRRELYFSFDFASNHSPRVWVKEHARSASQLNGQVTFQVSTHEVNGEAWTFYIGNEQKEILHIFHLEPSVVSL